MKKDTIFMHMSDGQKIVVHRWMPDKKTSVIGLVQLSHGMIEYAMRYNEFGEALANAGFVLYAHDHRGHGETAGSPENLGYLANVDGFQRVVLDLREVTKRLKTDFPGKKTYLFAHSFGSFVGQSFIQQFSHDIDGAILCGTSGPKGAAVIGGKIVVNILKIFGGKKRRSKLVKNMSFAGYNSHFPKEEGSTAWQTRDRELMKKEEGNIYSSFTPTLAFYLDLFDGLSRIHRKDALKNLSLSFPVYFIVGSEDPVGNYAKSVRQLVEIYKNKGMTEIEYKEYPGARHELLNETNRGEVLADIFAWLNKELQRNKLDVPKETKHEDEVEAVNPIPEGLEL